MDEIDEKISLYHAILEIEDWLGIKHNPNILKQALDTMENYYCDIQQMRDEIAYSELEEENAQSPIFDSDEICDFEKKRQIEEAYRELEAAKKLQIREHRAMMELDDNMSNFIQQVDDDILYKKLPLFKMIQEREEWIGIEHNPDVLELSENDMWNYYFELMDKPIKEGASSNEERITAVDNKRPLIDYSGEDLSLDPNMW